MAVTGEATRRRRTWTTISRFKRMRAMTLKEKLLAMPDARTWGGNGHEAAQAAVGSESPNADDTRVSSGGDEDAPTAHAAGVVTPTREAEPIQAAVRPDEDGPAPQADPLDIPPFLDRRQK